MFIHKVSPECIFNATCSTKLCQLQHSFNNEQNDDDDKSVRENANETFDDKDANKSEEELSSCNYCGEVYKDIDDLINHFGETGHNLEDENEISDNEIQVTQHVICLVIF